MGAMFQKMLMNTLKRHIGNGSQSFVDECCSEMRTSFDDLTSKDMKRLSEIAYEKAKPRLGEDDAKFLSGVIAQFENSKV